MKLPLGSRLIFSVLFLVCLSPRIHGDENTSLLESLVKSVQNIERVLNDNTIDFAAILDSASEESSSMSARNYDEELSLEVIKKLSDKAGTLCQQHEDDEETRGKSKTKGKHVQKRNDDSHEKDSSSEESKIDEKANDKIKSIARRMLRPDNPKVDGVHGYMFNI
ncbi:uncharacterized protein [Prorops nasuta]|uniref:uncharacterized protein n=1 Tax=Prorops nasuta TaxID=863751 RepID=UPI0034CE1D37